MKNPNYQKEFVEKTKIAKQNWSEEQKSIFSEKIAEANRSRKPEDLERMAKSISTHARNRDPIITREIYDKQQATLLKNQGKEFHSKSAKSFWLNATEEERKNRSEKRSNSIRNRSEEKRIEVASKRHATLKKNNRYGRSQIENECHEYIIKNIDKDVIRQRVCNGYAMDFYLPLYDLNIQLDGVFWHGKLHSLEQIQKMKKFGKQIIATMKNDIIQNETILNLIRISDEEFKLNPKIIIDKIKEYNGNKPFTN